MLHLSVLGAVLVAGAGVAAGDRFLHTFKRQPLSDQFWGEGASFADFNNDGVNDIVSGPWWYEGPAFTKKHEIYAPTATFQLKLGAFTTVTLPGYEGALGANNAYSDNFFAFPRDFNGDGWMDVLIVGFPGKETVWFQNPKSPDGQWARHVVFTQTDNESPTFADLTGDGRPELVCITKGAYGYAAPDWSDTTKAWTWHRISPEKGYGNFTHGMGIGDVNGDGRLDLIEKDGWWEQPTSLAGDPVWTFHPGPFGLGGSQMWSYDVNGDGLNDIITALTAHGYGLAWYEQKREGAEIRWVEHILMNKEPGENRYGIKFTELHALELVDIDGDGLKDIVTGKRFWSHGRMGDPDRNQVAVSYWFQLVRGAGGAVDFVPHLIDDNSGVGTQLVVGDVDKDGLPDLVVGNKKGTFVLKHEKKAVSEEEWVKAQPKPFVSAAHTATTSKEVVLALTAAWKGERLPDGRPKVSDDLVRRMREVSMEEAWGVLRGHGYTHQFAGDWKMIWEDVPVVGRALTALYLPSRPDYADHVNATGKSEGRIGTSNAWPIDALQKGDVYVADSYGKIVDGTLIGDNLGNSIFAKSGNGVVFNGSVRDIEGLGEIKGFNAFVRGWDPSAIKDMVLAGMNVPIRMGDAVVLPGDIVLGKREGVMFIPAQLAEEVVLTSEVVRLKDRFGHQRLREGKYTPGQVDRAWSTDIKSDFWQWYEALPEKPATPRETIEKQL